MWSISHSAKSTRAVDEGGGQGDGGSVTVLVSIRLDGDHVLELAWAGTCLVAVEELGRHGNKNLGVVSRCVVQGVMGCLARQVLRWKLGVTLHRNNPPPAVEGVTAHAVTGPAPGPSPPHLRPALICLIWELFPQALLLLPTWKGPL